MGQAIFQTTDEIALSRGTLSLGHQTLNHIRAEFSFLLLCRSVTGASLKDRLSAVPLKYLT